MPYTYTESGGYAKRIAGTVVVGVAVVAGVAVVVDVTKVGGIRRVGRRQPPVGP